MEKLEDIIQQKIEGLYSDEQLKEYENVNRAEIKHNLAYIVNFVYDFQRIKKKKKCGNALKKKNYLKKI